jgi:hypothetical protein
MKNLQLTECCVFQVIHTSVDFHLSTGERKTRIFKITLWKEKKLGVNLENFRRLSLILSKRKTAWEK